jgi:hypothetical protein
MERGWGIFAEFKHWKRYFEEILCAEYIGLRGRGLMPSTLAG